MLIQNLRYSNILVTQTLITQSTHLNQKITYCMLGNFSCFCCHLPTFFKINFYSKNSFRNTIRVSNGLAQIRTDVLSGSKQFAKVISRQQKSPLARRELTENDCHEQKLSGDNLEIKCEIFYIQ